MGLNAAERARIMRDRIAAVLEHRMGSKTGDRGLDLNQPMPAGEFEMLIPRHQFGGNLTRTTRWVITIREAPYCPRHYGTYRVECPCQSSAELRAAGLLAP